jgi:hypothetical protein
MALYFAIRKSQGKTVMAVKNSGESDGSFTGDGSSSYKDRRALDHFYSATYSRAAWPQPYTATMQTLRLTQQPWSMKPG